MSDYITLEDAALRAELQGNWLHAAKLWRQAATVAIGRKKREQALQFHAEALDAARRKLSPLPMTEVHA